MNISMITELWGLRERGCSCDAVHERKRAGEMYLVDLYGAELCQYSQSV